jgi:hypothetical protein
MSRLSVLPIVLALAIGPDATAICAAWCAEEAMSAETCDHGLSDSPRIAAGNCCNELAQDAVAVLQAAVRLDASSANGVPAVSPVRHRFVDSARSARPNHVPGSRAFIDGRPQTTVLRI